MSSLAMALHTTKNPPGDWIDKECNNDQVSPNNFLQSKDSNQMETDSMEKLRKLLEDWWGRRQRWRSRRRDIFWPQTFLFLTPIIFQSPHHSRPEDTRHPAHFLGFNPYSGAGGTRQCNQCHVWHPQQFLTTMKEADRCFTIFPHNLTQYGTLANLSQSIEDPEDLLTKVDNWLVYFPQAKPHFNRGDMYTTALIGGSILLGRLLKERIDWFKESKYSLWEVMIQMEAPVSGVATVLHE